MLAEILIVDDSAVQAATRKAILDKSLRSVQTASNAVEALALLDQQDNFRAVRLVVTDHWMPGMNGPEFVSRLRRRSADMPILVLSGLPDAEAEYDGMNVVFRLKPFSPSEFLALVKSLLDTEEPIRRTA